MTHKNSPQKPSLLKSRPVITWPLLVLVVSLVVGVGLFTVRKSLAASGTLSLSPTSQTVSLNGNVAFTIREDSSTDSVNAVQADFTYDQTKLQFVSIDSTTTAFSIDAPSSGGNGNVSVVRGTTSSVTGSQIVAVVNFKAISLGSASLTFSGSSALVRSTDNANILAATNGATCTVADTTAPSVPTGLTSPTRTVTQINLSWTGSTDDVAVTGYKVYRNGTQVGTTATTTYSDTGLTPGTSYSYTVAAYDAAGNTSAQTSASAFSTLPDTTAPSVPTGLTSPSKTMTTITLNWTASTDNVAVTGYKVYRNGTQVGSPTTTTYTDTSLTPGTSYSYTVAATDAAGNTSAQTSASAFSTLADTQAPTVPTGLTITTQTAGNVGIKWTASTDNVAVTGYKVYRNGSQIGTTAAVTYTDTTAPTGTYSYTVSAYDAGNNNSAQSTTLAVTVYITGDTNHDGFVNVFDLSILLSGWGKSGASDLNNDGTTNIFDLSILLTNWKP